jgi:mercuric ion transport protein
MIRASARLALPIVGAAFVACLAIQVFLAGLGVFDDPRSFITHREFGYGIGLLTLAMLVLALVGRSSRLVATGSALMLVQFAMQSVFIALRDTAPAVAALHPVNGFLILLVAVLVTRVAWLERRVPLGVAGSRRADAAPAMTSETL